MNTLILTSESQLTQMNTRFVITQDVTLSADVTIGTGCILSFQGGRLIKYQGENVDEIITITGSDTVIEAPLTKIFGDYITVAGKWKVPESYPEWFGGEEYYEYPSPDNPEITVVDTRINDANRINRACKLLSASDADDYGGRLKLTGKYTVYSTVIIGRFIYVEGISPYLSQIIVGDGFAPTAIAGYSAVIIYESIDYNSAINKGCGGRDFQIDCKDKEVDGLVVLRPYNQSVWENIEVSNVHYSHSAFVFDQRFSGTLGQTILLRNCVGYKSATSNSSCSINSIGNVVEQRIAEINDMLISDAEKKALIAQAHYYKSAPVFRFHRIHETTFIGCKGFANSPHYYDAYQGTLIPGFNLLGDFIWDYKESNYTDPNNVPTDFDTTERYKESLKEYIASRFGNTSFQFTDCRGITLEGCSVANTDCGIRIVADDRPVAGFTVSGLTSENTWCYDVLTESLQGNNVMHLTVLPIRKENTTSSIWLYNCLMGFLYLPLEQIITLVNGHHNMIYSVRPINTIVEGSNKTPVRLHTIPLGNTNVLIPNYNYGSNGSLNVFRNLVVRGLDDNSFVTASSAPARHNNTVVISALSTGARVSCNGHERISIDDTSTVDDIKFKGSTNNELAKLSAVTTDNQTSLTLQAKVGGNVMNLPIELSPSGTPGEYYLKVITN